MGISFNLGTRPPGSPQGGWRLFEHQQLQHPALDVQQVIALVDSFGRLINPQRGSER